MVVLAPAKAKKGLITGSALFERWRPRHTRGQQIEEGQLNPTAAIRVTGIVELSRGGDFQREQRSDFKIRAKDRPGFKKRTTIRDTAAGAEVHFKKNKRPSRIQGDGRRVQKVNCTAGLAKRLDDRVIKYVRRGETQRTIASDTYLRKKRVSHLISISVQEGRTRGR